LNKLNLDLSGSRLEFIKRIDMEWLLMIILVSGETDNLVIQQYEKKEECAQAKQWLLTNETSTARIQCFPHTKVIVLNKAVD
jgi:hypothetical protein